MPTFELLALDPGQHTRSSKAKALLHSLLGFSDLWGEDAKIDEKYLTIKDEHHEIRAIDLSESEEASGRSFILHLEGEVSAIDGLRKPLTEFLNDQGFHSLYVIRDEISEEIACNLYPHLYRIENLLRGFLIKFMTTKVGVSW